MSNNNRKELNRLFAEIGKIIADLNYWVKEFSPNDQKDFDKKLAALKPYPKQIYLWNENAKKAIRENGLFGGFLKSDEKITKLNDFKITDSSDIDYFIFNDFPSYKSDLSYPSDFEMLISSLNNKYNILEKIINKLGDKSLETAPSKSIVFIKDDKKSILRFNDKELKISYVSRDGQSIQSIIIEKIFKKPRKYKAGMIVSWDELSGADVVGDPIFKKEKIQNAIYAINQKSTEKLGAVLFNWNNGDIKILK